MAGSERAEVIEGRPQAKGGYLWRCHKDFAADAAQCTRANDALICNEHGLHYLLRLKDSQPTLYAEATRLFSPRRRPVLATQSHEVRKPYEEHRRLYISDGWPTTSWPCTVASPCAPRTTA